MVTKIAMLESIGQYKSAAEWYRAAPDHIFENTLSSLREHLEDNAFEAMEYEDPTLKEIVTEQQEWFDEHEDEDYFSMADVEFWDLVIERVHAKYPD